MRGDAGDGGRGGPRVHGGRGGPRVRCRLGGWAAAATAAAGDGGRGSLEGEADVAAAGDGGRGGRVLDRLGRTKDHPGRWTTSVDSQFFLKIFHNLHVLNQTLRYEMMYLQFLEDHS